MRWAMFFLALAVVLSIAATGSGVYGAEHGPLPQQKYQPDWASLDRRPLPAWFNEAKFGIFIVWGPYSVPSWVPGGYAEWYWKRSQDPRDATYQFHRKNYGQDFRYEQFAPMMKGELFDADSWAEIIARSGAKYTAFSVNYHDGFAMWPTDYAKTVNTDTWNAAVTGPRRDVTGELKAALEKKGVKFGVYYSMMEWYHPLWVAEQKEKFAVEWMHPKFKEVVTKYRPWFIFLDGEWLADYRTWHSEELAAWLYNDSPVGEYVVTNDRWGQTRGKHGDIFSSEYGGAKGWKDHPWQEDRGIGASYGYNRGEDVSHYNSPEQLIDMLAKCAAHGGNLLLDVGPTADGRIPVVMQERLLQMGQWLAVNGEAIYGTHRWKVAGEGDVRYTSKGDDLYVICTKWPGERLVLKSPRPTAETEITMLGRPGRIEWQIRDGQLQIEVPQLTIDKLPCRYAWVLKIAGISP